LIVGNRYLISSDVDDVTKAINAISNGDPSDNDRLLATIYDELRTMAASKMAGERANHTLQATALVNEAYLKLFGGGQDWKNRAHFYGAASEAMRRILVDSARQRMASKRGSGQANATFEDEVHASSLPDDRLIMVNEVLDALEAEDSQKAQIVKLRYFVGLSHHEIASLLEVNEKTVRRHWTLAKIWLYQKLEAKD